ncbi:MAG: hypothetical protein KKH41_00400 [Candidatus Thermoplasmatota archaeon]|nr:hypothetical protein [Euryarchaeota archaeon]MBU4032174.1 hypothetical protein [Candidatus Thermoplasmatota archaeon]MBU4071034.1 hypothetical protein [Candidatus Thermoplasmatota archaeon]MBU4145117.1 hypothetical protein [Candidatus Thermoplasmatota archaeon]MBU4591023.1 hypothetical protein [Candidatus Thermoplasmatota archaeon]
MPADEKDLTVSAFSAEEQNRKANLLQSSSILLLIGAIAGIIFSINLSNFIFVFGFMLIGAIISMILLYFGHIHFASWTLLLWMLAALMSILYIGDGIHDMFILLFPISIMIASMLFDRRNLIAYSLIVLLSMQAFIVCELTGAINNRMSPDTTILDMISVGILMLISITLANKSESIRRSFLKANQSNISLTDMNIKLQYEMKERNKIENDIKAKINELEQYKKATVDRELKMIELKERIKLLEHKCGVQG